MCKIRPVITEDTSVMRTLRFAAEELQKYLCYVSDSDYSIIPTKAYNPEETDVIYLGVDLVEGIPQVEDPRLDDAIYINIKDGKGFITGPNARSVLIGVYRFLKEKGFVFLRPGKTGEYYPEKLDDPDAYVCEKASYRHRGICIEGTVYQKCLNETIDWLPKAAMNCYMTQFHLPRVFFDRWYKGETPYREPVDLSDDEMAAIVDMAEDEIVKRGLMYHTVGHGWTARAVGISATSWSAGGEPAEGCEDMLAMLDGKRELFGGAAMNTNLCYSQQRARDAITDLIVDYCKTHPQVDFLHFWLSDGSNNNCECENCRDTRTSDFYVQMLNELDEKLTEAELDTKVVFLVYSDLTWRPLEEAIKNKDRFTLMFAPIFRTYSKPFDAAEGGTIKPYILNKLEFPESIEDNVAYLRQWQELFDGDSFDFDYHFMWDHFKDFSQYRHAQILHEDVRNLKELKLNGLMNCQLQRAFFPSCMSMQVMSQTLWNRDSDFDAIVNNTLKTEFGLRYAQVREYFQQLSCYGCPEAIRGEEDLMTETCQQKLTKAMNIIDAFGSVIAEELAKNTEKKYAWQKLEFFGELYKTLLQYYLDVASGKGLGDRSYIADLALKNEMRFKNDFDALYFIRTLEVTIMRTLRGFGKSQVV